MPPGLLLSTQTSIAEFSSQYVYASPPYVNPPDYSERDQVPHPRGGYLTGKDLIRGTRFPSPQPTNATLQEHVRACLWDMLSATRRGGNTGAEQIIKVNELRRLVEDERETYQAALVVTSGDWREGNEKSVELEGGV